MHACTEINESSSVHFFGTCDIVVFALATVASSLSEPKVDCLGPHAGVVNSQMGGIFSWPATVEICYIPHKELQGTPQEAKYQTLSDLPTNISLFHLLYHLI